MSGHRHWTPEEENYLAESWGHITIDGICRHLDRSKNAVIVRVNRLGLPPFYESGDYITVNALCKAFQGRNFSTYQLKSWVKDRGFPIHNKRRGKYTARVIYLDEFWEWAEKNRSFLDFSKMEPLALGKEPDWVAEQRNKDYRHKGTYRKDPWTADEDRRLQELLRRHKYSCAEISAILGRSEGAIQRRCNDLGLKERPVRADTLGEVAKWTDAMLQILADGIRNSDGYALIGQRIGKSEKAVRGKVYNTYLTETADKVRLMLGSGSCGEGAPEPLVRQGLYLPVHGTEVRKNLSILDGILRYRMNELGFDGFWQKDMCLNWSPLEGCTAGCTNCDNCTEFRRIQPQYCARCGSTFYEREVNRFCGQCRTARKKKAQRHWCREKAKQKGT